jgi:ketosteroid isomerase-like protein
MERVKGMSMSKAACAWGLALVGLVACGPSHLTEFETLRFDKEAQVKDSSQNREVLEVVNAYRVAMEKRDVSALRGLVSAEYYENAGTTETTSDDYGAAGVPDALSRLSEQVRSLNLEMVVKEVEVEGDRAYVVYEYVWNYRYEVSEAPQWEAGRDVNRMELVRDEGGLWKISRGL